MGAGESSFFSEDDLTNEEQEGLSEIEQLSDIKESVTVQKKSEDAYWYIYGGGFGEQQPESTAMDDIDNPEAEAEMSAPPVDANGEVQSVYKWLAYVSLVFLFLGHICSLVVFSLLVVPPKETSSVEDELIAMWYPLIFWPIYTGAALILYTVFSQLHVSSQPRGTSGRWRFKNPMYVWEAISTIFGLWLFYATGIIIVIVIGAQLGIYYEPDDEVPLDNDTDKYNFLNFILWFVSAMCAYISFNFMCTYMTTEANRTVAITGDAGSSIVSFNYNKQKKQAHVFAD